MSKVEIVLVIMTWVFLIGPGIVIYRYCLKNFFYDDHSRFGLTGFGIFLQSTYGIFMMLALVSHIRCWLSNPGWTPDLPSQDQQKSCLQCDICNQYKPKRTHHCKSCKKCVHRLDHHCIWVSNCIGALNQKYFIHFLFYTTATCVSAVLIVSCTFYQVHSVGRFKPDILGIFLVVFTVLLAILFFFFAGDFFLEQMESVRENQTCVESYQYKRGVSQDQLKNFEDVFGKNLFSWFLPVNPNLKVNYLEDIVIEKTGARETDIK